MKNNSQKIIVIRERNGSGCIFGLAKIIVLLQLVVVAFFFLTKKIEDDFKADEERLAKEPIPTREELAARAIAPPNGAEVKSYFRGSIKKHLHDPSSYSPVETYGPSDHPNGYLYTQTYRAKNAFGANVLDECGLLCLTNKGHRVYKFLPPDALKALRDFLDASSK